MTNLPVNNYRFSWSVAMIWLMSSMITQSLWVEMSPNLIKLIVLRELDSSSTLSIHISTTILRPQQIAFKSSLRLFFLRMLEIISNDFKIDN